MYLETIYVLSQQSPYVRSVDVAEHMGFSKPSVSRGMGVSVVSELTVREELESGKLLSFDLDSGGVYRNIYLTWRKDIVLTAVEQKFVEYVKSRSEKV